MKLLISLLVAGPLLCVAQALPVTDPASGLALDRDATGRWVMGDSRTSAPWIAPVTRRWRPLIEIESVMPSIAPSSDQRTLAETQIHYVGGPLQDYLNVNFASLANRMYDSVAPFGATGVMSLANGRAEVYGGMAGVFVPFATPYSRPNAWLVQTSAGVRVRLDPGSHFWLGATAYYLTDFADKKRERGSGTADLTVRFGR